MPTVRTGLTGIVSKERLFLLMPARAGASWQEFGEDAFRKVIRILL